MKLSDRLVKIIISEEIEEGKPPQLHAIVKYKVESEGVSEVRSMSFEPIGELRTTVLGLLSTVKKGVKEKEKISA